jgi:hypothetical protein
MGIRWLEEHRGQQLLRADVEMEVFALLPETTTHSVLITNLPVKVEVGVQENLMSMFCPIGKKKKSQGKS